MSSRGLDVDGRVALVTGGGAGIGAATARALAARGARVAAVDRDLEAARATVATLAVPGLALEADVTDRAGMAAVCERIRIELGGIDLVVANAGITPPPATLRQVDLADFDRVIDVNLTGVLNTVRPAIEDLIDRRGAVAVIASCAAFCPPLGGSAYMVSKAGVEVLGRALRLELAAHDVTVSTVLFGIVETALTRATLDGGGVGESVGEMIPALLRRRISAEQAATVIVEAIAHGRARVVAPKTWVPLSAARGLANPVLDAVFVRTRQLREVVAQLEKR